MKADQTQWHRWFAWYSVDLSTGRAWLRFIERRGFFTRDSGGIQARWEFREPTVICMENGSRITLAPETRGRYRSAWGLDQHD